MADSAAPFLSAVVAVLKAQPGIAALVGTRVYGETPSPVTYPYVLVTCSSKPFAADDFNGMEHTLRVQSFARENKPAITLALRAHVYDALNRQEIAVDMPDNDLITCDFDMADDFPEPDGRTHQSVIEFKALVN